MWKFQLIPSLICSRVCRPPKIGFFFRYFPCAGNLLWHKCNRSPSQPSQPRFAADVECFLPRDSTLAPSTVSIYGAALLKNMMSTVVVENGRNLYSRNKQRLHLLPPGTFEQLTTVLTRVDLKEQQQSLFLSPFLGFSHFIV